MTEYKDATHGYTSITMVRDLWGYIRPYKWRFIGASLGRAVGDIAWLYPSLASAAIVNELVKGTDASISQVVTVFGLWGLAIVVRAVSQSGHRLWGYWISERVELDVLVRGLRHLMLLDMAWHEREGSGNKIKRIQNAAEGMDRLIRMWFNMLIEIGVNFVGILYIFSTIDAVFVWITLVFMVTYFMLSFLLGRRAALASLAVNKEGEVLSGVLYETASNMRTVKILSLAPALSRRVSEGADVLLSKIRNRIFRYSGRTFVLVMWGQLFNLVTLMYIALSVMHGESTVGVFILFARSFGQIWSSVGELADFSQEFMTSKLAIARLQETLREQPAIPEVGTVPFPNEWKEIRLENVTFSYGDSVVLKNITLRIQKGQKIGVVGLSGAGKSTLFKLLLKERDQFEGEIYIDDIPLRSISRASYFERVSAVLQETEVFNLSLKENITIASTAVSDELFMNAIRTAHVSDFALALPQGVDTVIGERGVKLSGGERQRLGIARAIYKQPELLLMDEATSHLDSESEDKIQESLGKFFEQVTAIVIAHRLSTIKAMDSIIVIEGGEVLEQGSFEELLAKKGRFSELWEKQKL